MGADDYVKHCEEDHKGLKRMYDIQKIGECFLSFKNSEHGIFNTFERMIISCVKQFVV